MSGDSTATKKVPQLQSERLLLVVTGAASASYLPFWLNWLRENYSQTSIKTVLTRSAERFVTPQVVAMLNRDRVASDMWSDAVEPAAFHVEMAEWADTVAVFPASAHFIARLALGICDTPVLLALQCMKQVIGLAPSVPPGMTDSPVYAAHLRALAERPNIAVAPTEMGRSAASGRYNQGVAAPIWVLIEHIEKQRAMLASVEEGGRP
jgi:phosphopantothenoylcysteine synthetase/decarboxylase